MIRDANDINELFYKKFGNGFFVRLRRKFFYTKAEKIFLLTPFCGLTGNRPKYKIRITE